MLLVPPVPAPVALISRIETAAPLFSLLHFYPKDADIFRIRPEKSEKRRFSANSVTF